MNLDWHSLDRWMMGEAWTGARIDAHLAELCERIGPRWSSSAAEREAIHYLRDQMQACGLEGVAVEEFPLNTWSWQAAEARVVGDGRPIDLLPFDLRMPNSEFLLVLDRTASRYVAVERFAEE